MTMKMGKEGYEKPYKKIEYILLANKTEAGTREKMTAYLIVM